MRTTLNIADDVLLAVQQQARRERRAAGDVLSDLARQALTGRDALSPAVDPGVDDGAARLGFPALRSRGGTVTNDLVNRLREDEG